ncbi:MAG: DUF2851 family protein [Chloroflexota bacterium]|nr:DUF2851 family protein [Chloroflexota bacterium]
MWASGSLPANCSTVDGRRIEVIYRGQWSHGYGPDFRDAILSFGHGPAVRGDVELHVRSSDWRAHGHDRNPLYDRVILHVVWEHDPRVGLQGAVLELSRWIDPSVHLARQEPGLLDTSVCSVFGSPEMTARALGVIESAGDARFDAKVAALEGDLAARSADQVLYAAVMECMGYSENKVPFRLLAESLPVDALLDGQQETVFHRLQAASGLDPSSMERALLRAEQWQLARVRPSNHPLRRMRGIAEVLRAAKLHGGLTQYLVRSCVGASGTELQQRLTVRVQDAGTVIGPERALETLVNAVVPFAVAYGRWTDDPELERWGRDVWSALPRTGVTRLETLMRAHLEVPKGSRLLSKARHQQGLIHLYRRYCRHRLCEWCPLSRLAAEG